MTGHARGILWMSASVVVFIFNDALIKLASETMPPLQAIGLRGCFATLWCLLALLMSNLFLLHGFYLLSLSGQILFYLFALGGWAISRKREDKTAVEVQASSPNNGNA